MVRNSSPVKGSSLTPFSSVYFCKSSKEYFETTELDQTGHDNKTRPRFSERKQQNQRRKLQVALNPWNKSTENNWYPTIHVGRYMCTQVKGRGVEREVDEATEVHHRKDCYLEPMDLHQFMVSVDRLTMYQCLRFNCHRTITRAGRTAEGVLGSG